MSYEFSQCFSTFASNTTTLSPLISTTSAPKTVPLYIVGVLIACCSPVLNGIYLLLNKTAHRRVAREGGGVAAEGSLRYCCEPRWWLSIMFMVSAEGCNFGGYTLASALAVAPIGGLTIVASTILAFIFLRERPNARHLFGMALCLLGTTFIVCFVPKDTTVERMIDLKCNLLNHFFLGYVGLVMAINIFLVFIAYPLWGRPTQHEAPFWAPVIPITTTASFGSLTVCSSIGIGIVMKRTFSEDPTDIYPWKFWLTYLIFAAILITVCTEMIFINKAYSANNVTVVCPIHYFEFVALSGVSTSILYKYDWSKLGVLEIALILFGFVAATSGCFLVSTASSSRNEREEVASYEPLIVNDSGNEQIASRLSGYNAFLGLSGQSAASNPKPDNSGRVTNYDYEQSPNQSRNPPPQQPFSNGRSEGNSPRASASTSYGDSDGRSGVAGSAYDAGEHETPAISNRTEAIRA